MAAMGVSVNLCDLFYSCALAPRAVAMKLMDVRLFPKNCRRVE